jgi:hypothetical protein
MNTLAQKGQMARSAAAIPSLWARQTTAQQNSLAKIPIKTHGRLIPGQRNNTMKQTQRRNATLYRLVSLTRSDAGGNGCAKGPDTFDHLGVEMIANDEYGNIIIE